MGVRFFVEFNKLVPANTVTRKFFQELEWMPVLTGNCGKLLFFLKLLQNSSMLKVTY